MTGIHEKGGEREQKFIFYFIHRGICNKNIFVHYGKPLVTTSGSSGFSASFSSYLGW